MHGCCLVFLQFAIFGRVVLTGSYFILSQYQAMDLIHASVSFGKHAAFEIDCAHSATTAVLVIDALL